MLALFYLLNFSGWRYVSFSSDFSFSTRGLHISDISLTALRLTSSFPSLSRSTIVTF